MAKTSLPQGFPSRLDRQRLFYVVIGWRGHVPSAPQANHIEDRRQNDRQHKVQDDHREGDVHGGEAKAADRDRIERLESCLDEEGSKAQRLNQ